MVGNLDLFDKICNIKLITKTGDEVNIVTPDTGWKPDIRISGHFIPSPLAQDVNIRIANFYPDQDLRDFANIEITVGYAGSTLQEVISGQIWIAYRESPGPDGITYFQMKLGNFTKFINTKFQKNYAKNTPWTSILTDIGSALGLPYDSRNSYLQPSDLTPYDIYFAGFIKDAILKVQESIPGVIIQMDSQNLYAYSIENGFQKTWNIDYFSSPPRREAWGWTFVAPWIPGMRPGHYVNINSDYAKQTYSVFISQDIAAGGSMKALVQDIQFDFATNNNQNQMTVLVLDQYDQKGTTGG